MRWKRRAPKDKTLWHPWFAWRPVLTNDMYWAWLEWVERRLEYSDYGNEWRSYRLIQKPILVAESLETALREK